MAVWSDNIFPAGKKVGADALLIRDMAAPTAKEA